MAEYGDLMEMIVVDRDEPEGREFAVSHGIGYQPGFVIINPAGEVHYAGLGPYEAEALVELIEEAAEL